MRSLKNCKENLLFILDDFGFDKRGAYYLGYNCGNEIEQACVRLIRMVCGLIDKKELYFCGSSKGAYAALNFMTCFDDSVAIVGAPQYHLGQYLLSQEVTCDYIIPDRGKEKNNYLDEYLQKKLKSASACNHTIYLHFSDSEHTYDEHIKYMIEDLESYGFIIHKDIAHYKDHWDVGLYFSKYLVAVLQQVGCNFG